MQREDVQGHEPPGEESGRDIRHPDEPAGPLGPKDEEVQDVAPSKGEHHPQEPKTYRHGDSPPLSGELEVGVGANLRMLFTPLALP